jgi:hypothetical protein
MPQYRAKGPGDFIMGRLMELVSAWRIPREQKPIEQITATCRAFEEAFRERVRRQEGCFFDCDCGTRIPVNTDYFGEIVCACGHIYHRLMGGMITMEKPEPQPANPVPALPPPTTTLMRDEERTEDDAVAALIDSWDERRTAKVYTQLFHLGWRIEKAEGVLRKRGK